MNSICSIYLNHTSLDTVQALFYISVCGMYFTTKYTDLNIKLREPNLSQSGKGCLNSFQNVFKIGGLRVILPVKKIILQINFIKLDVTIFLFLKSKRAFIQRYSLYKIK